MSLSLVLSYELVSVCYMGIRFERIFLTNQRLSAPLVFTNCIVPILRKVGYLNRMASGTTDKTTDVTEDENVESPRQQDDDVRKMRPTILRRRLTEAWNKRSETVYVRQFGPKAIPMELYPQLKKYGEVEDMDSAYHLMWEIPPENVLIVKKPGDVDITNKMIEIATFLIETKGYKLYLESEAKSDPHLKQFSYLSQTNTLVNPQEVDFVICLGGDGTFLYSTSLFKDCTIPPIMCFGMGSLGFLTHFVSENYKDDIDRITTKHMSITLRSRICAKIIPRVHSCSIVEQVTPTGLTQSLPTDSDSGPSPKSVIPPKRTRAVFSESGDVNIIEEYGIPTIHTFTCINEVTVDRGVSPYLTQIEIYLNDFKITTAQADGIIVATPTGSTAYSLAAGASMLHPSTAAFIITPICPHSLSFRPIVVPNGVQIKLKLAEQSRHSAWVSFDGRDRQEMKLDDEILLNLDPNPVPCLNNTGHVSDWFKSLINGLNWNVRQIQKKI